jgi:hypothetical protein
MHVVRMEGGGEELNMHVSEWLLRDIGWDSRSELGPHVPWPIDINCYYVVSKFRLGRSLQGLGDPFQTSFLEGLEDSLLPHKIGAS